MAGHHERAALASSRKSRMKIPCHPLAIMGTFFIITPDDSGTAVSASAREFRNLILHLRPAERAEEAKSRVKYHCRGADSPAIHLDLPAADVDRVAGRRKIANGSLASELFPNRPDHELKRGKHREQTRYRGEGFPH